jgi:ABC-type Fe3+ transport system permease subunit
MIAIIISALCVWCLFIVYGLVLASSENQTEARSGKSVLRASARISITLLCAVLAFIVSVVVFFIAVSNLWETAPMGYGYSPRKVKALLKRRDMCLCIKVAFDLQNNACYNGGHMNKRGD